MKNDNLNILLIHPEIARTKFDFAGIIESECLDLEYLSALLSSKGHNVEIFDLQVEKFTVAQKLKTFNPDIVYLEGKTRQENFILEYCKVAKDYNENIITIIGGIHAQLCYERMYKDYVDYIMTTFDIYKILDIIDYHFKEKEVELDNVDGICYKRDGVWLKNRSCAFDINKLPLPDRTYFDKFPDNYGYLELKHSAWVRTAYCCPYHCSFCLRNRMNMGKYVYRDIEDVVEEIANIKSDNIYIVDDDFLVNKNRLYRFIQLIKEKNIHKNYICYGRTDFIAKNEDLMEQLKNIGLYYVLVGLEAINNDMLIGYNKKTNIDNNIRSIEICNKFGINIMGMFILDLNYSPKDFKNLYKWIKRHKLKHVAVSIYVPEMGLESYDTYKDCLVTDNPAHWDYLHVVAKPEKMSVKRYYIHYYILLIKLFFKGKREGVYDFLDYNDYIKTFIKSIFRKNKHIEEK